MSQHNAEEIDIKLEGPVRVALVCARWNAFIVEQLESGCHARLAKHGIEAAAVDTFRVPGAYEIPVAAKRVVDTGRYDAVITFGAVIRGDTPHFEYVAGPCASEVARIATDSGVPVIFGVLTVNTEEQAVVRADPTQEDKGGDAAAAALEMIAMLRDL